MLVRWSVGPSVRWLVGPHITSKTEYVAIVSRLGFGVTSLFQFFFVQNYLRNQFSENDGYSISQIFFRELMGGVCSCFYQKTYKNPKFATEMLFVIHLFVKIECDKYFMNLFNYEFFQSFQIS
jgi:hypothetical protein